MAMILRPSKEQIRELLRLFQECRDSFPELLSVLESNVRTLLRPEDLKKLVAQVLLPRSSSAMVKQLLSLNALSRRLGIPICEVVDALKQPIAEANGEDVESWDDTAVALVKLLSCKAVRTVGLAVELSYEYANLLRHTRILSDIRPIFSEDAARVEAAVVSFTLRLHYDSADGEHDMSIVLDEADVRKLQEQCTRALKKADTAKAVMEANSIHTIIAGQSVGDDDD